MESLGKALARLDIRTRRAPVQIDRNTLENQIRKIFFWVWDGKPAAISRAQMCTLLKQTEGLMTAVENSRRALGLPKSRAKNPHYSQAAISPAARRDEIKSRATAQVDTGTRGRQKNTRMVLHATVSRSLNKSTLSNDGRLGTSSLGAGSSDVLSTEPLLLSQMCSCARA